MTAPSLRRYRAYAIQEAAFTWAYLLAMVSGLLLTGEMVRHDLTTGPSLAMPDTEADQNGGLA